MNLPSLSIVIPTYNGLELLQSLLPQVHCYAPPGTQVIVVDDASTDATCAWLRNTHPWAELVEMPANQGFCAAVNTGIARARGDVVELLNNDTAVSPHWAEAALQHFADPTVGSVAPLVLFLDHPDIIDSAGQEYHLCGWGKNRAYGQRLNGRHLVTCEVFGPSASCGFYRRKALEEAGLMLPEYGAYYEDVDLSFRLRWAGYRCIFEPAARVFHQESASYRQQRDQVVWLLARNEELVYWVNLRWHELLLGFLPHLGFLAVRAVRKSLSGQGTAFFTAKWDALCRWRWIFDRRRELQKIARSAPTPVHLQISRSPRMLQDGWHWMTARKSA
jgi:GT2 family glycosyltransferase